MFLHFLVSMITLSLSFANKTRPKHRDQPKFDIDDVIIFEFDEQCVDETYPDRRELFHSLKVAMPCIRFPRKLRQLKDEYYVRGRVKHNDDSCLDNDVDWDGLCLIETQYDMYFQEIHTCDTVYSGLSGIAYAWNLDLLDDTNGDNLANYDSSYTYPKREAEDPGIDIYVLDGAVRLDHEEFQDNNAISLDGWPTVSLHGTHVAGTAVGGGFGVAKGFQLYSYAICRSESGCSSTDIYNGVEAVVQNMQATGRRGVINFSIGAPYLTDYWENWWNERFALLRDNGGIPVVAAGNEAIDACWAQPAFSDLAITVGAFDYWLNMAYFTNYGSCVDIFAPGVAIPSAFPGSPTEYGSLQGTSMSAPFITGLAGLYLMEDPSLDKEGVVTRMLENSVTMDSCQTGYTCYRPHFQCTEGTRSPSDSPVIPPSSSPTVRPTNQPTEEPSNAPTKSPSVHPTTQPSNGPTVQPTSDPTRTGETQSPSVEPSQNPSMSPSAEPSQNPSTSPLPSPTNSPVTLPCCRAYSIGDINRCTRKSNRRRRCQRDSRCFWVC